MGNRTIDTRYIDFEEFHFSSDQVMNTTLDNAAAVDAGSGSTTIPLTGHGYVAGSMIFLQGTTNYDGVWTISAVAANTFNIPASYVAETFAGTEIARPAFQLSVPGEFLGYELHLASACGTAEDFEIHKDADQGAAWDTKIVDEPMNTVQDLIDIFDKAVPLEKNDIVYCTFPNTNTNLFGLTLYARRL